MNIFADSLTKYPVATCKKKLMNFNSLKIFMNESINCKETF